MSELSKEQLARAIFEEKPLSSADLSRRIKDYVSDCGEYELHWEARELLLRAAAHLILMDDKEG